MVLREKITLYISCNNVNNWKLGLLVKPLDCHLCMPRFKPSTIMHFFNFKTGHEVLLQGATCRLSIVIFDSTLANRRSINWFESR